MSSQDVQCESKDPSAYGSYLDLLETNGDFWELTPISSTEEWQHYMHAALESGWPLTMVIQIHQKTGDLGEGSTQTTSDCNEEMEKDKEEENMQAPELEPEPQGLADEGERIPRIVEDMEKEDQDAQIMEQCGDSSDDLVGSAYFYRIWL